MKRQRKNNIKPKKLVICILLIAILLTSTIGMSISPLKKVENENEQIYSEEYPFSSCGCFSSSCDVTVSYSVSGPDENNNYQIHYKVTNNGNSKEVNRIEVGHGPESTGTDTASAPNGWDTEGTKPVNGDTGGMFFESSIESTIKPGETQKGFSWTVNSPNGEPTSNSALVWCKNSDGTGSELTYVNPKKDEGQTESKNCENPEDHGFSRDSSDGENGFEVIPDDFFHNENCVIAVGDINQPLDDDYTANLISPLVDMSWNPSPEVQFTHKYNGWEGCTASVWVSSNNGDDWTEFQSYGRDCGPGEICSDEGRIILPILELGSSIHTMVKWEFTYAPKPDAISSDEIAFWILDDILLISDETSRYKYIFYVDNNNTEGPWDGTEDYPFIKIQDAIDAAPEWSIINLEPSLCGYSDDDADDYYMYFSNLGYEHIWVYGDGHPYDFPHQMTPNYPILNLEGKTIKIESDNIKISGCVIRNCGGNEEDAAIEILSNHNTICNNIIEDNQATGIYLHDSANHNMIYGNTIKNNEGAGVFIWESSNYNYIFHNNFLNNGWYNAKDKCTNHWDNKYPSGGNYWDDYTGLDANGDGIGDNAYDILGDGIGYNNDRYPLMNQNGWNVNPNTPIIDGSTSGKPGLSYQYLITSMEPNGDKLYFVIDYGDGSQIEISDLCNGFLFVEHIFEEEGTYSISAKAVDILGEESNWAILEVTMPKTKSIDSFNPWLIRLIQRFPILENLF